MTHLKNWGASKTRNQKINIDDCCFTNF